MSRPAENLYQTLFEPKLTPVAGKQGLRRFGEGQFRGFFYTFGIETGPVRKAACRWESARRGPGDRRLPRWRELSRVVALPWGLRKRRFKRVRAAAHGNKGQSWLAAEMTFH